MKNIAALLTPNWHFNVFYVLLLIAAASLPFTTFAMLPIAILMLLNWIIEWNWKEKWQIIRHDNHLSAFIIFTLLYFIVIIGFCNSANKAQAWEDLECKLWFFTAPLFLLTTSRQLLTRERLCKVLFIFASATFIHICVLFVLATFRAIMTGHTYYFYYVHLSVFCHPSYISMYATTAFFLILYFLHTRNRLLSLPYKMAIYGILLILAIGIFCLRSKAGTLIFCFIGLIWFFYLFNHQKRRIGWSLVLSLGGIACLIMMMTTNILPMNRFKESFIEIKEHDEIPYGQGSSQVRLTVWQSAWEISKKNLPWGVGTGDATDELCNNAVRNNYTNLIGHHYNAHNQYLQCLLTVGIPGIIALLLYCFYPVFISLKRKDILYLSFSLMIILNLLVECMFEVRAGVDFIALFNILLFILKK